MIYVNKKPLLEDSFNAFVKSIDIAYALNEGYEWEPTIDDGRGGNKNRNKQKEEEPKWLSNIIKTHQTDIRELQKTTQNLKDMINSNKSQGDYEKELIDKRFENLKNISYKPMAITKQTRPFTSLPFPANILYLVKQVFIWVGNFLTKAFAKIAEIVASLTGNKMQATISLAKDAFIKEEEFMKGTFLPIAFNSEKESISKIGQSDLIIYGSNVSDKNKYTVREDLELLSESYNNSPSRFAVYDMSSTLTELKKYMATFLSVYDTMQGSFGENLVGVEDIEQLYTLFHDQLEAIKVLKSGGVKDIDTDQFSKRKSNKDFERELNIKSLANTIRDSYAKLSFRVDPRKIKAILETTLENTERLKKVYSTVQKKVVDILGELLSYQNTLFKQTGTIFSAFSGDTMSEMILLTDMYEDKIGELKGQIKNINDTKNKLNNLLKSFSNISGIFNGFNIYQAGNYQVETGTEITKISEDIRQVVVMLIQTVQLRYDNAYRYLDTLSSVKDLIVSVNSINANRKTA